VHCFLLVGADRAVLVDTGTGIADISVPVRGLTEAPVLVVNTHSHDDHRGGNAAFDAVAAHPVAVERLVSPVPVDRVEAYLGAARAQYSAFEAALAADDRFFHQFTAATRLVPVPDDLVAAELAAGPSASPLADGEQIDLGGGRRLTVRYSPGHSPDSLCLVDEQAGLLFVGDSLITGDFWAHTPDTDLASFVASLRRLHSDLGSSVERVFPAHTRSYEVTPTFLRDAADGLEAVLDGRSVGQPGIDLYGRPVLRHRFAEFNVLRPVEA
jgi:glyoxylase-like metal-dependent hydrolase (beta-lactamase superfamily II)